MAMPIPNLLPSKDGSERARLRRCVERVGVERVRRFLNLSRATVLGYTGGGETQFANEAIIVLRLPELEAEVERLVRER
jgi:hypothetical protein